MKGPGKKRQNQTGKISMADLAAMNDDDDDDDDEGGSSPDDDPCSLEVASQASTSP